MRALLAALAILAASTLTCGCALQDPYQTAARTAPRPTTPGSDPDGPPASAGHGARGFASASAALAAYARAYANWSWRTLPEASARLAAISTGQARQAALALAQRAGALARWQVADSGQLAAIAPGRGPRAGLWAVVVIEQTTGSGPYAGLPATSQVSWARVARSRAGWQVSGCWGSRPGAPRWALGAATRARAGGRAFGRHRRRAAAALLSPRRGRGAA